MTLDEQWIKMANKLYEYAYENYFEDANEELKEEYEELIKLSYNTKIKKWICRVDLDCIIDVLEEADTREEVLQKAFLQLELNLEKQKTKKR